MKRRIIGFVTLAAFLITNITSVMPRVSASEEDCISYEYEGYSVCYDIIDSWDDMQKVSVSIQNTGSDDIENWMLYFDPKGEITDIWNAEKAITTNNTGYLRNSGFNSVIRTGESTEFGYIVKNEEEIPDTFILCQTRIGKEEGYSVDLKEINSWEDVRFQGEIIIRNESAEPIEAWKLSIDTNFTIEQITNSWAAEITDSGDGKYELKGTYNSVIQPYSEVVLGFLGVKNGTPEIYSYSLSEVKANEELLMSLITESFEEDPDAEISMYASGEVNNNELSVSWIPDKEISGMEYRVIEINGDNISVISSTQEMGYVYELSDDFSEKRVYIEAYYNGNYAGKSNEFIVKNTNGVFSYERADADNDNISDYIEELIGTDVNKKDTDEDGLDDYLEFFVLETDPLKPDTDDNGVYDGDEDCDSDGLTNSEEIRYGVNPVIIDTDNDKLSDYDELFVYHTDPLLEDTDDDTISDYDEVMLGIDPNNAADSDTVVEQKIEKDSECFSGINVEGLPYKVSMDIKASGYVAGSLTVDNSDAYASTYSFDTIGEIPEFVYDGGEVQEVTINFELEDDYVEENNVNIESLNVFKYFDEVNMFVPVKTYRDSVNNIISCQSDSLGTYCVKDVDEWMLNFSEPESENIKQSSAITSSNALYSVGENELFSEINYAVEEPVNVIFAIDQTFIAGSLNGIDSIKNNIINVSEKLFRNYKNIKVTLMVYCYDGTYINEIDDLATLKNILAKVNYISGQAPYVEAPLFHSTNQLSSENPKYIFVYNGALIREDINSETRETIEMKLSKEKKCCVSFVSGLLIAGGYDTINAYADAYNGKVFNLYSDSIDKEVYDFIRKEDKLIKNFNGGSDNGDGLETEENNEHNYDNEYTISTNFTTITLKSPINRYSKVDTDGDKLLDYEELVYDSDLIKWDVNGNIILPTLKETVSFCGLHGGMKYLPDDILDNPFYKEFWNKEILPIRSNPTIVNTDYDKFSDSDEILIYNTNPLKSNSLISSSDVDFLLDNNRYAATACRDYNQNLGAEIAVAIANNVFGTVHDYKFVYKNEVLNFIESINYDHNNQDQDGINYDAILYFTNLCTQAEALLSESIKSLGFKEYKSIIEDFALERTIIFNDYYKGTITQDRFIELNNNLLVKFLDNKTVSDSTKHLEVILTIDKFSFVVTGLSIAAGGAVQVNKSVSDVLSIIKCEKVIKQNMDILDEIIKISDSQYLLIEDSVGLANAVREIKKDIEAKVSVFYNEMDNIRKDCFYAIYDGAARAALANWNGIASVIIATIALTDSGFGVSNIGQRTLLCYTDATISDALCNILNSKISRLSRNMEQHGYVPVGDYIVYEDITWYYDRIISLCTSRRIGEDNAIMMFNEEGNSKGKWLVDLITKIMHTDSYIYTIENNRSQLAIIKERYL